MKGKERSPLKKRARAPDEGRDRGGSHSSGKKTGSLSASGSNSSVQSGSSSRRSIHADKRDIREGEHNSSGRTSGGYDYGGKPHGGADISPEASRSAPRPLPNPECEYKTLKISELGNQLNDEEIEDGLFHEFKKFGDVSVKISRENDERVAFVNFRRPDDARAAKHARGRLVLYDRPLKIETVYGNRRRSRSPVSKDNFLQNQRPPHSQRPPSPPLGYRDYRLQQLALGRLPPPAPPHLRELERDRDFFDSRGRPPFIPECFRDDDLLSSEDGQRPNRTLFLGNLDLTLTENDLRIAFDRFGVITEVDIKRATRDQNTTYGFIKFENLDMAHRAKLAMSGKVVGHSPIKIGYGKPTPTTRLWVGGLGPWVHVAALAKEFDRFGTIRTIDYRKGEAWAYIQYESLDAALAAWTHMRGFPLGGPERRLRVDFAETEQRYQQQPPQQPPYMQLPLAVSHYDHLVPEPFAHRLPEPVRLRDRSPPLPPRFRDRDPYPPEWSALNIHERMREPPFVHPNRLDRHSRDFWALEHERELQNRDLGRKRRHLEDGWRHDRSPDHGDYIARRHGNSLERSPGDSSRDGRFSDSERLPRSGRASPMKDRNSHDFGEKRRRTFTPTRPTSDREHNRRASDSGKSPSKRDERADHPLSNSSSKTGHTSKQAEQRLRQVWQGSLLLKNSSFPTALHLLEGDLQVASGLLVEGSTGGPVSQLKISQRLRLDQPKLDEVSRRIKAAGASGFAILLAVPGKTEEAADVNSTERPLKNLVSYLKQKEAAGIISLPVGGARDKDNAGVLHAFPPCEFSQRFVDAAAKAVAKSEEDCMVMVIIKGS